MAGIYFWYCSSKAEWPRHKCVDNQVKASTCIPTFPSKESYLFSKKKECNNTLCKWQMSFANSFKKGYYFLNFEDEKKRVIKPTYTKGGSWLPIIDFTNSLCAHFTCMTTGYAPIREYRQWFFPHLPTSCPCGKVKVQTWEHIIMECDRCKGTSRVVLSKFWGSVLLVAQWQIVYCTPTVPESSLSVSCSAMPSNL